MAAGRLTSLGEMIPDLTVAIAPLKHPENPPWTAARLEIHDRIPDLSRKGSCPDSVVRSLAESHLEERFQGYLRIYTDGSVHRGSWTAAAAYVNPELGVSWSVRLITTLSSTVVELEAVTQALTFLSTVPTRCAIQRLAQPQYYIDATTTARRLVSHLAHRGHALHIQWVPGHVGIPGNVAADTLAKAALRGPVSHRPDKDPW